MNLFEKALRNKLRFMSVRGELTTEQLWDVPLTSRNGFDLDTLARDVSRQLKEATDESFVAVKTNPAKATLEHKLEVLKAVIAEKIEQAEKVKHSKAKAVERQRLMEILHQKKDQALAELSPEEIQKRLDDLAE